MIEVVAQGMSALLPAASLFFNMWAWFRLRTLEASKATTDSIAQLALRLQAVERDLARVPTHEDVVRINDRIEEVAGAVRELSGEFAATSHTLKLIHEHLLNGGRR